MQGVRFALKVLAVAVPAIVAACAPVEAPQPHLRTIAELPGWPEAHFDGAFAAIGNACALMMAAPERDFGIGGAAGAWIEPCKEVVLAAATTQAAAFTEAMERNFVALDPGAGTAALVTGYYVPQLDGSRVKDSAHPYPLYKRPLDPTKFDRAEIDAGALAGEGLELVWVSDKIDAFFLQVQGSGIVRLTDGQEIRVNFAGTNERTYVSVGKAMVDAGIMTKEEASLQTIRAHLQAHPGEIDSWLHRNPRFVFFKEAPAGAETGAIGALGLPLTRLRSIAADPEHVPLGLPLWLDTTRPISGDALQMMVVAQDKGAAIKGPGRLDLFWGEGREAEAMAGPMRQAGTYWLIVPRAVGERWLAAQGS